MRRIFTYSLALLCLSALSLESAAQQNCGANSTALNFPPRTFDLNNEDFSGDWVYSNSTGGQLFATFGGSRRLETSTFLFPATGSVFTYGFELSGPANVTTVDLKAIYVKAGGGFDSVTLCTAVPLSGGTSDALKAPINPILNGKSARLVLVFHAIGNISKNKYLDNFRTSLESSPIVLPVRFGAIDAKVLSSGVNLTWNVDAEENLRGYEVERSADGVRYASIGNVAAAGQRTYSYFDGAALASAFYRIKSVDVDGKAGYSTIVRVNANGASIVLKAFMSGMSSLLVQHDAAITGARISVSTADGRIVRTVQPQVGMQQTSVDLSGAARGMYIVRYEKGNGEVSSIKLMKQ